MNKFVTGTVGLFAGITLTLTANKLLKSFNNRKNRKLDAKLEAQKANIDRKNKELDAKLEAQKAKHKKRKKNTTKKKEDNQQEKN